MWQYRDGYLIVLCVCLLFVEGLGSIKTQVQWLACALSTATRTACRILRTEFRTQIWAYYVSQFVFLVFFIISGFLVFCGSFFCGLQFMFWFHMLQNMRFMFKFYGKILLYFSGLFYMCFLHNFQNYYLYSKILIYINFYKINHMFW